jgi:hypothetical protein
MLIPTGRADNCTAPSHRRDGFKQGRNGVLPSVLRWPRPRRDPVAAVRGALALGLCLGFASAIGPSTASADLPDLRFSGNSGNHTWWTCVPEVGCRPYRFGVRIAANAFAGYAEASVGPRYSTDALGPDTELLYSFRYRKKGGTWRRICTTVNHVCIFHSRKQARWPGLIPGGQWFDAKLPTKKLRNIQEIRLAVTPMSGSWVGWTHTVVFPVSYYHCTKVKLACPALPSAVAPTPTTEPEPAVAPVPPAPPAPPVASAPGTLPPGATLTANQYVDSPASQYRLWMSPNGNLVLYVGARVLWSTQTHGHPGARAVQQTDGNLVVYSQSNAILWSNGAWGHPGATLYVQPDGNLVTYDEDRVIWATGTVNSQLLAGETLLAGHYLNSSNGRYSLRMQPDGNLVLRRRADMQALWDTHTWGNPGARAIMQKEGNLAVYSGTAALWWTSPWDRPGASLIVQPDGNVVIYHDTRPIWATNTHQP